MHVNKEEMAPASQVTSVETLNELAVVRPRITVLLEMSKAYKKYNENLVYLRGRKNTDVSD